MAANGNVLRFLQQTVRNLPDENQLSFVLERIAVETNTAVLVYDTKGELIGSIGGAPSELIWEVVETDSSGTGAIGRWAIRFRRFGPNREAFILVLATRVAEGISVSPAVIDAAEIAVNAVLAVLRGSDVRWVRENSQLLEALEQGVPRAREHRFWSRLAEYGFSAYTAWLVIVDESVGHDLPGRDFLWEMHERAHTAGVPLLAATRLTMAASDAIVHMLVTDSQEARDWISSESVGRAVGISGPHYALTDAPVGLREAEYAQQVAMSRAKARISLGHDIESLTEVTDYQKLRLGAWAAIESPRGEFHMRQRAILAPFDGYSEILDTVVIFLANDLKVNDTAQELFLHPNTVRYRLGRAEKLIGGPLSSPLTLTDLTLALEAEIWAQRKKG